MHGLSVLLLSILMVNSIRAQCPWQKDIPDLQTACLCAYNLGHELSVQCDQVIITGIHIKLSKAKVFYSNSVDHNSQKKTNFVIKNKN